MKQADWLALMPKRAFCANDFGVDAAYRPKRESMEFKMIQPNHKDSRRWMTFDLDREDSYESIERSGCPVPNFVVVNRTNGHAHAGYLLAESVGFFGASRSKPAVFYSDVRRGLTRKMGADIAYSGLTVKNPYHPQWATIWNSSLPYDLGRLNDYLTPHDKRPVDRVETDAAGRNCALFEFVRKLAYSKSFHFQTQGRTIEQFTEYLLMEAIIYNQTNSIPLGKCEVRSVARSVASFCYKKLSPEKFSSIQRARVQKRWNGVELLKDSKPWIELGLSRATFFRRKAAGKLPNAGNPGEP